MEVRCNSVQSYLQPIFFVRLEVICNCIRKLHLSIIKYFALDIPTEEQLISEHLSVQLVLHLLRYTIGLKNLRHFSSNQK